MNELNAVNAPALSRLSRGWLIGAGALVVLLVAPALVGASQLHLPTEIFLFALFALTYDLLFGYTGLISFGHALFIGVGAYTLGNALSVHGTPLWLAFLIVLLAGLVVSGLTGLLALRTRGVYFAMVTLALAQMAFTLAQSNVGALTNGDNGLGITGAPDWLTGPGTGAHFYYVALFVLVAGFLLLRRFVSSPAGQVWQAIRENEQRALMLGYRPFRFKLLAYVISGSIATLAGSLYALFVGTVSTTLLSADLTIQLLLMVIIGGAGSLWGAMVGAALMRYLNQYLNTLSTSDFIVHAPNWVQQTLGQPLLIFGCVYLVLVLFFPQGIAGLAQRWRFIGSATSHPGLSEAVATGSEVIGSEAAATDVAGTG